MVLLHLLLPVLQASDQLQAFGILAISIGLAGLAILILFSKRKI